MSDNKPSEFAFWLEWLEKFTAKFRLPTHKLKEGHTDKFEGKKPQPYEEVREKIHNGDLLFCGGTHWLSKVIRYFSGKSDVSHVGIIYWWKGRLMLFESVESKGVRIIPLRQYVTDYNNTKKPYSGRIYIARHKGIHCKPKRGMKPRDVDSEQVNKMLEYAATLLNKKFSVWEGVRFFWHATTGHGKYDENEQYLCSEFVAKCFLEAAGITFKNDHGFAAPEHIAAVDEVGVEAEIDGSKGASEYAVPQAKKRPA
jgi:hypothetical protein